MKNFNLNRGLILVFLFSLFISCSDDDNESSEPKKDFLITKVSSVDETQIDFDNVDQVWEYDYDENDRLSNVYQYHPGYLEDKVEFDLIYDTSGEIIKIKRGEYEYEITNEEGKISLYGMGNDIRNYYFNSERLVTRVEDVFIGQNTNFKEYFHNEKGQLVKVEGGTDGIVDYTRLFMDFDDSEFSFQFFDLFPTQDFIITYAFNLKYNSLGKPDTWDFGYYEYEIDNNKNVSELKVFYDINNVQEYGGGYRFNYTEK